MEENLRMGHLYKWTNNNSEYLTFEFTKSKVFLVVFVNQGKKETIYHGTFKEMLETANELVYKHNFEIF
jgi:hypothetical protein